ncbi:helix-turn-helix domain-containing protein [Catellatospora sp. NPDC049111]|uniref:helix-turn-helix domain-containing protein n=1 Tax=Catellatospora sp. NPDC049111 TaxID=3155271 RepID=UPI0033FA0AA9
MAAVAVAGGGPDPARINDLGQLVTALAALRRQAAGPGRVQVSGRELAKLVNLSSSTLNPYLRGDRLIPRDVLEDVLRQLGVPPQRWRPWFDAWERVADTRRARRLLAPPDQPRQVPPLAAAHQVARYRFTGDPSRDAFVGIVAGDIRRVDFADVWVNSENTSMEMARFEERSLSAIVRYGGAVRDEFGRVLHDLIAEELSVKVNGRRPVAPGTAVVTGPGALAASHNVRYVLHVAAVSGEPGEGYRPVADLGRCTTSALRAAEDLGLPGEPVTGILLPLFGAGVGGGDPARTAAVVLDAVVHHLATSRPANLRAIYVLASTAAEVAACHEAADAIADLVYAGPDS